MIQAYLSDQAKLIVGVTRRNVELLTSGKPLKIHLFYDVQEIAIVFGETKPEILEIMKEAGITVTPAMKADAAREPL